VAIAIFYLLSRLPAGATAPANEVTALPTPCAAYAYATPFPNVPPSYKSKYHTIAHAFLDEERLARPVSSTEYAALDELIEEARTALHNMPASSTITDSARLSALTTIDCTLVRHGFVYPIRGFVQLLSDAFDPTDYNGDDLKSLQQGNMYNERRVAFITQRGNGPFYVIDCDTASYVYLAIGEVMRYPLAMGAATGHNFVQWIRPDGTTLDFETMKGTTPADAFAATGDRITTLTPTQLQAYHDSTVGQALLWQKRDREALAEFLKAYRVDDSEPTAPNEMGWLYAVDPPLIDGSKAVAYAERAVTLAPNLDNIDTLACAYETAGDDPRAKEKEQFLLHRPPGYYTAQPEDVNNDYLAIMQGNRCTSPDLHTDPNPFRNP
jgi:hypothetical protein